MVWGCAKKPHHHCSGCCHAEPLYRSCISTEVWSQEVSNNKNAAIWRPCMKSSAVVRNNSSNRSFDHWIIWNHPVFWRSPWKVSGFRYCLTVSTIIFMETSWFPPPSVSCQRIATLRRRIAARIRRLPWQMLGLPCVFEWLSFWGTHLFDVNFLRFNVVRPDNAIIRVI